MAEKCVIGAALDISKIIPNDIITDTDIFHEVVTWSPQRIVTDIRQHAGNLQPNKTFRDEFRFAVNLNPHDGNPHDILTKSYWCIRMKINFCAAEDTHKVEVYLFRDLAIPPGEDTFKGLVHVWAELLEESILLPETWITPTVHRFSLFAQVNPLDRVMAFKEKVGLGWDLEFPAYQYDDFREELLTMEVRMQIKMKYLLPPPIIPLPTVLTDVLSSTSTAVQNFLPADDSDGRQDKMKLFESAIAQLTEGLKLLRAGENGKIEDVGEVSDAFGESGGPGEEEKASTSQQSLPAASTSQQNLPAALPVPFVSLLEDADTEYLDVNDLFPSADGICDTCRKWFKNLPKHIKDVHEKPYKCTYEGCNGGCGTQSDLDRHIRHVHLKERPCPCPSCDKMFTTPSDARRHLGGVHGICGFPGCSWTDSEKRGRKRRWEEHTKETHK